LEYFKERGKNCRKLERIVVIRISIAVITIKLAITTISLSVGYPKTTATITETTDL
jgi:hypothetical protein